MHGKGNLDLVFFTEAVRDTWMLRVGEEVIGARQFSDGFDGGDDCLLSDIGAEHACLVLREALEAKVIVDFAIFVEGEDGFHVRLLVSLLNIFE
jgi:hypothetical protein